MTNTALFQYAVFALLSYLWCVECCDNFKAQWRNDSCEGYFANRCYSSEKQKIMISTETKHVQLKCVGSIPDMDAIKCISMSSIKVVVFRECNLFSFNMKHLFMNVPIEQIHLNYYSGSASVGVDFVCHNIVNLRRFVIKGSENYAVFNHSFKGKMDEFVSLEVINHGYTKFEQKSFSDLSNLEKLTFKNGVLREIRKEDFRGLTRLRVLDFRYNKINRLDSDIFKELTSLYKLDITGNQIASFLSEHLQISSQLSVLRIGGNTMNKPPVNLFQNTPSLKEIDIHGNTLGRIEYGFFQGVSKLKTLNVSGCSLRTLEETISRYVVLSRGPDGTQRNTTASGVSYRLPLILNEPIQISNKGSNIRKRHTAKTTSFLNRLVSLQRLDLSHNNFMEIKRGDFDGLNNLVELYISHNPLRTIPPSNPFGSSKVLKILKADNCALYGKLSFNFLQENFLDVIDLAHNRLNEVTLPINSNKRTRILLNNNHIKTILIDRRAAKCNLNYRALYDVNNNSFVCNCGLQEFINFLQEDRQENVFINGKDLTCGKSKQKVIDVDVSRTNCPLQCFIKCKCMTNLMNCYGVHLTEVPPNIPPGIKALNFSNNKIKTLSNTDPEYWKDATTLYISQNLIETIDNWEFPTTLHLLALDGNKLTFLPQSLMEFVNKSENFSIYLAENSWKCDCSTLELKDWFMLNIDKIKDVERVRCILYHEGTMVDVPLASVPKEIFCVYSLPAIVYVCCLLIALLILVVSTYVYYFRFTVLSLLHSRNLLCYLLLNRGMEMKYDSFLCFSPADQEVVDILIEEIEPLYKFCLPERDWSSKFGIHKNIVQSILNSRTTLLLVSKNSVDSLWFMVKFRCAYNQMKEDRMHRLIVLIIGDVGEITDSNSDLKQFIASHPNIRWGEKWFWEKLHFSLSYQ